MFKYWKVVSAAFVIIVSISCASYSPQVEGRENEKIPVILVHGVMGWGRDDLSGFYYWGGITDLEAELRARGYDVRTAGVGPVSSSWDRACELYACIKGGKVDYGRVHSSRFGHERFGGEYPGLFPEWGTPDPESDETRKVHIIGHSMGGQTARHLAYLLQYGSVEEAESVNMNPLFEGGKEWVMSVTTISTPHDGSTMIESVDMRNRFLLYAAGLFAAISETEEFPAYDLRLSQWGLVKQPDETWATYRRRVMEHHLWSRSKDIATWDVSVDGAAELNRVLPADPDIYYFSWASDNTKPGSDGHTRVPGRGMLSLLRGQCRFIGSYVREEAGNYVIDEGWFQNDGVVNTCSMDGPSLGSSDMIVPFSGVPRRGIWNFMGVLESCDHLDTIGVLAPEIMPNGPIPDLIEWYANHLELLYSLPE